ncbi:MAG: replicative DNA helicase [Deltaproteobacteria bacterium]|nr:replicative DNA helicase [Deltaproteobacteria bacterium]
MDAEQYLIGGVLLENSALDNLTEIISPEDFYSQRHKIIYAEMLKMRDKGVPIDIVSLPEALGVNVGLEKVGGASYIAQLGERIPTTANIEYYAKLLRDKALLRSLITGAGEIIKTARSPMEDVSEAIDAAEQIIFNVHKELRDKKSGLIKIGTLLPEIYHNLSRLSKGEIVHGSVQTQFSDLNEKLMGGLHATDLVIVAGRPSMGKTSLAVNIAQYVAIEEKSPVAIFSLEMGKEQLATRMLSSQARIDQAKIRKATLKREDWNVLIDASNIISEAPLYIDDTPGISPMEIRAKLRRLAMKEDLGLVVIDYMQLMSSSTKNNSREQEISEISRGLKSISKEFNVPVIALSQLNRKVEGREDKRPMMSELRESGAIEQDADIIFFIYRDEFYHPNSSDKGIAELIIAKHRNGPTGTVKLKWFPEITTFEPLDSYHE